MTVEQRRLLALLHNLLGRVVPLFSEISHVEYENLKLTNESRCDIHREQRYEASKEKKKIRNKTTITKLKIIE